MMTADSLARELGCTLADLDDMRKRLDNMVLTGVQAGVSADSIILNGAAGRLRAEWSKRTGIDYTETVK